MEDLWARVQVSLLSIKTNNLTEENIMKTTKLNPFAVVILAMTLTTSYWETANAATHHTIKHKIIHKRRNST